MIFFKKNWWWKGITMLLILYSLIAGFLMDVPRLPILNETIRNLYYHVPMWFGMIGMLGVSMYFSIRYLQKSLKYHDIIAHQFARVGILFGIMGMLSGMVWAKFTWGAYWSSDPKQNASAIGLLIYLAYMILRDSLEHEEQKARIGAVYNIFAYFTFVPLIFIIPRITESLHPGSGGNPGFNVYDLNAHLRIVFYPSIVGWTLLGVWLAYLGAKIKIIEDMIETT